MKKVIIILMVFLLTSCKVKREAFYNISFDGMDIAVGYDTLEVLGDPYDIDTYETFINDDGEEILRRIVVYVADIYTDIYVDDYLLTKGIKKTCSDLKGEFIEKNGHVCLISKEVDKRENYIILYGDILNDDIDKIDRIEVVYDK